MHVGEDLSKMEYQLSAARADGNEEVVEQCWTMLLEELGLDEKILQTECKKMGEVMLENKSESVDDVATGYVRVGDWV